MVESDEIQITGQTMKRAAQSSFVGLALLIIGCSKDESSNLNRQEIAELKNNVTSIQETLKRVSASLAKVQQSQEEIRQQQAASPKARQEEISTRLTGIEKRLAESSIQIDAIAESVKNLKAEKIASATAVAPAPVVAVPAKNERTKEFLLAAVDRGEKQAAISGLLSEEDKIRLIATTNYLRKEIRAGNDPRLTTNAMLMGTQANNRIMRFFPEFLPE